MARRASDRSDQQGGRSPPDTQATPPQRCSTQVSGVRTARSTPGRLGPPRIHARSSESLVARPIRALQRHIAANPTHLRRRQQRGRAEPRGAGEGPRNGREAPRGAPRGDAQRKAGAPPRGAPTPSRCMPTIPSQNQGIRADFRGDRARVASRPLARAREAWRDAGTTKARQLRLPRDPIARQAELSREIRTFRDAPSKKRRWGNEMPPATGRSYCPGEFEMRRLVGRKSVPDRRDRRGTRRRFARSPPRSRCGASDLHRSMRRFFFFAFFSFPVGHLLIPHEKGQAKTLHQSPGHYKVSLAIRIRCGTWGSLLL